jgi:hypothetical protein
MNVGEGREVDEVLGEDLIAV